MTNQTRNNGDSKNELDALSKPKSEYRALLRIRERQKRKKPHFVRQESWRYGRVHPSWRRPKGIDSTMRLKKKGRPKVVEVGYRSPRLVRGFHPTGFKEILAHNIKDLEKIKPNEVVRIGHTVGLAKRVKIVAKARELGLHILNTRGVVVDELEESETISV